MNLRKPDVTDIPLCVTDDVLGNYAERNEQMAQSKAELYVGGLSITRTRG